ncbi:MAG: helix-turn-helix domain-containing protein [Bacteroidetes bacterium]|nr:MAG: helix-turn-helix domain-containing protein [Bacteroidota bacterium]
MARKLKEKYFIDDKILGSAQLKIENVKQAANYVHEILDKIDSKLLSEGADRISEMIELANLSSMLGNLFGAGIANYSKGVFKRNGSHKYPDILAISKTASDIEIKFALEDNKPKGHLAKAGFYLTCRYMLGDEKGNIDLSKRGNVVWIWEIRFGYLKLKHFNISNTAGDSGKTAVVNKEGFAELKVLYCDLEKCPHSKTGKTYNSYLNLYQ